MTELRHLNRRFHRLLAPYRSGWESLAERSATLFLAGGGLSFVTAALFAVEALTALSAQGLLTGVTGFTGIVLSYVGLLGLYPWFVDRTPRSARVGFVLVALPTLVIVVITLWGITSHVLGPVPFPIDVVPDFGLVLVATFLLFAAGIGLFGVSSLRTGVPGRDVGLLLLVLAATWVVLLGASWVYGSKFPAWLDFVTFGVMAVALSGIGYSIRTGAPLEECTGRTSDTAG